MPTQHETLLRLLGTASSPSLTESILSSLRSTPSLASQGDVNGYTLLHAAVSYGHADIMRALVQEFHVDVNIKDLDGDTPLYYVEKEEIARLLVEELGADVNVRNEEDEGVLDRVEGDGDIEPGVVIYLREKILGTNDLEGVLNQNQLGHVPNGMNVELGTGAVPEGEADPEIKRRIDELAAREDLQTEEGQRELRKLVEDVVGGMKEDVNEREPTRMKQS
jgi:hypothetical protein